MSAAENGPASQAISPLDVAKMQRVLANRKTRMQRRSEEREEGVDLDPLLRENPLLQDIKLTGFEDDQSRRLIVANHLMARSGRMTLRPLLPLLLQLKGRPYDLRDHFPFEPFFRTRVAKKTLLKTGRQVSKSTSLASQGVLFSNCIPYFSTLYVTPLFEMIRRFSQNYVRPFIETSPVMKLFSGSKTVNSVLQRSFKNRSQMIFSFAFLDAERTRGIAADKNVIDEVQDMNIDLLPIIHETMSGSTDWGLTQYAGTPKTLDNTIERLWLDSSMAEWMIKCPRGGCNHWNVPSMEFDLVEMIGPYHSGISEQCPGVVCAKCQKPINPRPASQGGTGRWSFAGYHVPQVIMPMHYANPEKWQILLGKQAGKGNTPIHVFFNEVCGESYDSGSKLVTLSELLRAASLPWGNSVDEAVPHLDKYVHRICAVDWGGGGVSKGRADIKYSSYTSVAVLGLTATGEIHVLYGFRSQYPHAHVREARIVMGIISMFRCSHLIHDYTGAGEVRETVITQAGFPAQRIVPVKLTPASLGNLFRFHEATDMQPRAHFRCDKPRSLNITCELIRCGAIRFFQDDYKGGDEPGLLRDFLNLIEEKSSSRIGGDIYTIMRDPAGPDDFAQAVNLGVMALHEMSGRWPDLVKYDSLRISREAVEAAYPASVREWDDM
jgi:hypothetical protein